MPIPLWYSSHGAMTPRVRGILESAVAALGSAQSARLFDAIGPSDFDLPARLQNLRRGEGWQEGRTGRRRGSGRPCS